MFLPCLILIIKASRTFEASPVCVYISIISVPISSNICVCIEMVILGRSVFFLKNGLNNSRMSKTCVKNEISLSSGTSVFCLCFPRGLEGPCTPSLFEESWCHLWRIPLGWSTEGWFKVNQIIGGEISILVWDSLLLLAHQILSKALGPGHPTSLVHGNCLGTVHWTNY